MVKYTTWGDKNQYYHVPIKVIERDNARTRFDIIDGQCVLITSTAMATLGKNTLQTHLTRYIDEYFNPLPKNIYIRTNDHIEDYQHLVNGTHRGSINHATGEPEGGLSVARLPEYPAKYAYYVQGEKIGEGTDGEPLLDLKTIKVISKPMSYKQMASLIRRRILNNLPKIGITETEYIAIKTGGRLVWND
jgi:hypothetical protein